MKRKLIKDRIRADYFIKTCNSSSSMAVAAAKLSLHFNSFKKRALELNCYSPNQAGIGLRKNMPKIAIEDIIIHNKYPHYQSYKLKKRLLEEGWKIAKCESCGLEKWREKSIPLELHHIDGKRANHNIKNLKLLCPNCHSQTDNFRAKNKK